MPILKVANIHFNASGTRGIEWRSTTDNIVRVEAGAVRIPIGSTGSRPTGIPGLIRYNTTTGSFEGYNASSWGPLAEISAFESGTKWIFAQTTAPTGWTKQTSANNNHTLRVVTGTAANGGTVDFSTAFTSKAISGTITPGGTSGGFTLTTNEIPSHQHNLAGYLSPGTTVTNSALRYPTRRSVTSTHISETTGGGGSHSHPVGTLAATFTGNNIDLTVRYVDVIIATKD